MPTDQVDNFKPGELIKLPNHVYYTATFLYQFLSGLVKSNDVCISPRVPSERDGRLQHGVWEGRGLSGPGIRYEVPEVTINGRNIINPNLFIVCVNDCAPVPDRVCGFVKVPIVLATLGSEPGCLSRLCAAVVTLECGVAWDDVFGVDKGSGSVPLPTVDIPLKILVRSCRVPLELSGCTLGV